MSEERDHALVDERLRQVREAVETWTGQLINLDGSNRLLYYRDLKVGTLDLAAAFPAGRDALLDGRTVRLSQLFGPDELPAALKRARAIRNKSRELLEERGIVTLFLAVGMATWTNTKTAATPAAPVLLREATIAARGAAEDDFDLALTGEVDVNPTLLHMLDEQHNTRVDAAELLDLLPDSGRFDPTDLMTRLTKEASVVPGFAITDRHVLGTFSYAKLPMVTDLQANLEALVAHDVVAAIAGNHPAQASLRETGDEVDLRDPDRTPPADEFLVLDADSSQNYAINAVVKGRILVIAGPPGTGKSQTIANLIATLVARGQRVLFVAEKRAAIAAVLTRLERVGLADLVMDLHDGAGSKRKIAANLAAALRAAGSIPRPNQFRLHERVVITRERLNAHADAMHAVREPWQVSVFEAQEHLLRLEATHAAAAATRVRLRGPVLAAMDATTFRQLRELVHEFAGLGGLTLTEADSAWAGAHVTSSEQAEAALVAAHRLSTRTFPQMRSTVDALLGQTGLVAPTTVARWKDVLDLLDQVAALLGVFDPSVWTAPLQPMVAATAPRKWRKEHGDWPGASAGWRERRRTRKAAKALLRAGDPPGGLHAALMHAQQVRARWKAVCTDAGEPRLPAELAGAEGAYGQFTTELAALGAYLAGGELAELAPNDLDQQLARLTADERTLRKLPRLNELSATFRRAGLDELLAELRSRRLAPDLAVAAFENCWYASILERIGFDDPAIARFDPALHTETAGEFRTADGTHIRDSAARVRRAAAERLVAVRDTNPEEGRLVEAEAAKQRRHLPLRDLFQAAPNMMTALKPCWAMSPLVVSQLLPGNRPYFDVVVFDEASQITPADAVPAILRAGRVVVAGDEHQLPPTNFFASAGDDDGAPVVVNDDGSINLALTAGYESILKVLTAAVRTSALTWHYRSRDERLIAFSNGWVYDHSLTTFPGVAGDGCLAHVLVDQPAGVAGQEDSVTAEVDRVVELVLDHAEHRPDESLGVIAMGIKHADRIDVALRAALHARPELHRFFDEDHDDAFFVKNLERVQGDERDAIILSIGYGKSPDGRLPYRFGPLLQEGGHRRLNVAVTRARTRMTVVSSFSHHDMDPDRSKAPGVQMLRAYLQFAASGGTNLGDVIPDTPELNFFEISVRDRLVAAGIPLVAQYGVAGYRIDFAAAHPTQPGRMVLAIEADGATYHSSHTARDRDRLRQEHLERLGWSFHRIWSTDWFNDPDTCVARARVAYEQAVAAADAARAVALTPPTPEHNGGSASHQLAAATPPAAPRRRFANPPVTPGYIITDYSDRELAAVIDWIESDTLLRTRDQLLEEWMAALGFQRRGARIVAGFDRALAIARSSGRR